MQKSAPEANGSGPDFGRTAYRESTKSDPREPRRYFGKASVKQFASLTGLQGPRGHPDLPNDRLLANSQGFRIGTPGIAKTTWLKKTAGSL